MRLDHGIGETSVLKHVLRSILISYVLGDVEMSPPKDVEHVFLPSPNMQDIPIVAGALTPHFSQSLLMSNDATPTFSTSGPKPHSCFIEASCPKTCDPFRPILALSA